MKTFKQFLIEYNAPLTPKLTMMATDAIIPIISGEGGGPDVTVMNPKGAAFNNTTKPTLGMGFEMAPNLVGTVQKFVDKYSNNNTNNVNKLTNPKTPATKTPVTWQTMNQAVSNQQAEELNKLLVKHNLKSSTDNPPRAWGDDEMDDYYRWLDQQMQEWELANPKPEWVDGMSWEEWQAMMREWETREFEHRYGLEHWHSWNIPGPLDDPIGTIPQRNPLPMPKPRIPTTWSPKPWWAPETPPNNPNWWHWGPDGSDRPI